MLKRTLTITTLALILFGCGGGSSDSNNEAPIIIDSETDINKPGIVTIVGDTIIGQQLTAQVTDEDGVDVSVINYQWFADGIEIPSEITENLLITDEQINTEITVSLTYTDNRGFTTLIMSEPTPAVVIAEIEIVISGSLEIGKRLTAVIPEEVLQYSQLSYQWLSGDLPIVGATSPTIIITDAQIGEIISFSVSYVDVDGNNNNISSSTTTNIKALDTNGIISISGIARLGETLTTTVIDENGLSNVAISYQWKSSGIDIEGFTESTFTIREDDIGKVISVTASYIDQDDYFSTINSEEIKVDVNGALLITGEARVGERLTSNVTDDDGLINSTIVYQWKSNENNIPGATASSIILTNNEADTIISLFVSYVDDLGYESTIISENTGIVIPTDLAGFVSISGIARSGETLTATVTDNNGLSNTTIAYQWLVDGEIIVGAVNSTLILDDDNASRSISVLASYTDEDGYNNVPQSSPINIDAEGLVSISGIPRVGQVLTAVVTDSNGLSGVVISYQWKSAGLDILNATASTLILTEKEINSNIAVAVSYTDAHNFNTTVESINTANVVAIDVNGIITITGLTSSGEQLTATVSDENGLSESIISYQWQSDDQIIVNATSETFTLTDDEVDKVISVSASYVDDDGYSNSINSTKTATVIPADASGVITITGLTSSGATLVAATTDENGLNDVVINYQWSANDTIITDATTSNLLLTDNEVDKTISVSASYTDEDGYENTVNSLKTSTIVNADVIGTVVITGALSSGGTLSATPSDVNGLSDVIISYQWKSNEIDILNAVNSTLLLTDEYIGKAISVFISYTDNDGYINTPTSTATALIVAADVPGSVSISGITTAGETLTATLIDDNGISGITPVFQWLSNGIIIPGATSATYVLTGEEVGEEITVSVSYTDEDGYNNTANSLTTEEILIANILGGVVISGTVASASTLTATVSDGNGLSGVTISYQWKNNGLDIPSATSRTLLLTDNEIGDIISVSVSYTDEGNYNDTANSDKTTPVIRADIAGTVSISGQLYSGGTLNSFPVDGNGLTDVAITYQWKADDINISSATSSTLLLTDDEIGNAITLSISYTDEDGYNSVVNSLATGSVVKADVLGTIAISGTAKASRTLTTLVNDENGLNDVEISYQWIAGDVNISNATSANLLLTENETGEVITVVASYTDEDGFSNTITSTATQIVIPEATTVNNKNELINAIANANVDDLIELAPGDYSDIGLLTINTSGITIARSETAILANTAISGVVCFHITQNNNDTGEVEATDVTLDNLFFNNMAVLTDSICDTASSSDNYFIHAEGENFTLKNTTLDTEIDFTAKTSWVNVTGINSTVSRNTFKNKRTDNDGAYLKLSSASSNTPTNYIIEYNLFSDFSAKENSSAHAIMLGSTTGSNSINISNNIVRYNLFDNIDVKTRVIRVQSSNNDIYGNTFANGYGMVSLENGQKNTVRSNVFIGSNSENYESGVNAAPYEHIVSNNYFVGLADDSNNERAALVLTANENSTSDSGNNSLTTSGVIFTQNTIVNSMAPLLIGEKGCSASPVTSATLSNNLFLNDYSPTINTELTGINGAQSVDDGSIVDDCADSILTFENDHFYSDDFVNGSVDPVSRTIVGTGIITAAAPNITPTINDDGFIVGVGDDEGIGADTTKLYRIKLEDVGSGTDWVTEITH